MKVRCYNVITACLATFRMLGVEKIKSKHRSMTIQKALVDTLRYRAPENWTALRRYKYALLKYLLNTK